ncbi:MAG TPA: hypothetical protein VMT89_02860 [Candidatus Acidoferrales bacterium]|nr:hypothetical protein [Candidatus Acidoferrales bacterium]
MTENEERDALRRSIERDEQELRAAVHDLTGAARAELGLAEHIQRAPLTWVAGGLLIGMWLGSRDA